MNLSNIALPQRILQQNPKPKELFLGAYLPISSMSKSLTTCRSLRDLSHLISQEYPTADC